MAKSYNLDRQSDRRRFARDMAKAAENKANSIKRGYEFSVDMEENPSGFSQKPATIFPYSSENEKLFRDLRKLRCPNCFKLIGVKIGANHCPWCKHQFEVNENSPFVE